MYQKRDVLKEKIESCNINYIDNQLILQLYDVLCYVRDKEKGHGMTIVLGYDKENKRHRRTIAEMCDNAFFGTKEHITDEEIKDKMHEVREIDGAILVDNEGNILMGGVYFLVNPIFALKKIGISREDPRSLPERFGFKTQVGTRHISSISASYKMYNSFIFALSEETNLIRVFFNGKIFFSEIEEEMTDSSYPIIGLEE